VRREEDLLKRIAARIDGYRAAEIVDLLIDKLKNQVRDEAREIKAAREESLSD
jgi:hypothetical protein